MCAALAIFLLVIATSIYAEDKGVFSSRSMTVETASKAAWQAMKGCRDDGYSVAVAVVDKSGILQVFYRDRFAGPHTHTVQTAIQKAWTAVSFHVNTGELADMLQKGKIPQQVQHNPGALLVGGGVNIYSQGELIGAIGVSGAPPGKSEKDSIDGACAKKGIKIIEETLEFAD